MLLAASRTQNLLRYLIALLPLSLILSLVVSIPRTVLNSLWLFILICTALFYAACYAIPRHMYRWQSMPCTFLLHNNLGDTGLHRQLLTYAAYHTNWYNHITHAAFPVEALSWMVVITYCCGVYGLLISVILLTAQAFTFSERIFTTVIVAFWMMAATIAIICVHHHAELSYYLSVVTLISCGFWRFTGHWIEFIPPGLLGNKSFLPLTRNNFDKRLIPSALLGFFSEFGAGLPFRLVIPWIYVGLQIRFVQLELSIRWNNAKIIRAGIHNKGWRFHPVTKELVGTIVED